MASNNRKVALVEVLAVFFEEVDKLDMKKPEFDEQERIAYLNGDYIIDLYYGDFEERGILSLEMRRVVSEILCDNIVVSNVLVLAKKVAMRLNGLLIGDIDPMYLLKKLKTLNFQDQILKEIL
jgi:hypothetical protein